MDTINNVTSGAAEPRSGDANEGKITRQKSQIEFPYTDLSQAEDLVRKLVEQGGGSAEPAQLAVWMDQSATGGTFRSRLSAARMFGFIDNERDMVRATDEGRDVLEAARATRVRADAFLRVPLFSAMYDKNKGYALPPPAAIERQMVELGVPVKQKERARQVFMKSATIAQFIDANSGRLTKPAVRESDTPQPVDDVQPSNPGGEGSGSGSGSDDGGNGGGGARYHAFIQGLLDALPPTEGFTDWTAEDQAEWLRAAASIFKLLSKQKGRIRIEIVNEEPGRKAGSSWITGGVSAPPEEPEGGNRGDPFR